jgi:hypothetical protein
MDQSEPTQMPFMIGTTGAPQFVSYASDLLDLRLWRALHSVQEGFYIEIGSSDPISNSVSYGFHLKGWSGVVVEPAPHAAIAFRQERPHDHFEPVALGASTGNIPFFEVIGRGISSPDPLIAAKQVLAGFSCIQTVVPLRPLDQILDCNVTRREVHWLAISVVGMEADVIAGWTSSAVRPWIVIVNSIHPASGSDTHNQWEPDLIRKGYIFSGFDGVNRFYVHQSRTDLAALLFSPTLSLVGVELGGRPCHPLCADVLAKGDRELNHWRSRALSAEAALKDYHSKLYFRLIHAGYHSIQLSFTMLRRLLGAGLQTTQATLGRLLRRAARTRLGRSLLYRLPVRLWAERIGLFKSAPSSQAALPLLSATASRHVRWLLHR